MKWHKVKSRRPPVEEEYVATKTVLVTDGTYITCAYYALDGSKGWYMPDELCHNSSNATYLPIEPTHWAHIPDLPGGNEERRSAIQ
jgi:hypothetical protein